MVGIVRRQRYSLQTPSSREKLMAAIREDARKRAEKAKAKDPKTLSRDERPFDPDEKITFETLSHGVLHIGYRRRWGQPGQWLSRRYMGTEARKAGKPYDVKVLDGSADDEAKADGVTVLDYNQAVDLIRNEATVKSAFTVADAFDLYWEHREKLKGSDTKIDRGKFTMYVAEFIGKVPVAELTLAGLKKWRNSIAAMPAKYRNGGDRPSEERERKASANKIVTLVKAALNEAFKQRPDIAASAEAWRALDAFPNVEKSKIEDEALPTQDEVERLVNAADAASGFRDLLLAALHTGCRYGELTGLKVKDFEGETLRIVSGKIRKVNRIILDDEAKEFFERLVVARAPGEPMLLNRSYVNIHAVKNGTQKPREPRAWRKSEQDRPMRRACKRAGVGPWNFHITRHIYASYRLMNGAPELVVAQNLGHKSTVMLQKHYGHLTDTYRAEALQKAAPKFSFEQAATNVAPLKRRSKR